VALVRGNERRFIVVHFPKLLHTDAVKILPLHRGRKECLSEVELYGPLGGPEMMKRGKRFTDDPNAFPMFMGAPSHVRETLPRDLVGAYRELGRARGFHPAYHSGGTVADNVYTCADAGGAVRSIEVREPSPKDRHKRWVHDGRSWYAGAVTPTTTPARYAGRLIVGCSDGKLHAVADNGTHLWAFRTDGRIYSSPVPEGDEVYFGSDDGNLYKVDVDSGILIWEFATGGKVRSAPALAGGKVYAASYDGFLYAVDTATGHQAWKAPIAKYTRSSPAVRTGRVYVGDEDGRLHCLDAATGRRRWVREPGDRISVCPVVTGEGVFVAGDRGRAAFFGHDGAERWRRDLGVRLLGQPVATRTQLLLPAEKGLLVLRQSDGRPDERFVRPADCPKIISALPYGDKVFLMAAFARTARYGPRTYATYAGFPVVWGPKPAADEKTGDGK
jgi:hypothetical protein